VWFELMGRAMLEPGTFCSPTYRRLAHEWLASAAGMDRAMTGHVDGLPTWAPPRPVREVLSELGEYLDIGPPPAGVGEVERRQVS
jgi:hypothetical protein